MSLTGFLPDPPGPDALYEAFVGWAEQQGLSLYPHQEEAVIELCSGSNVILATPTGSGKSMVAVAAHFTAMAEGRVTFYTAPIKALVSEKFFALCETFGAENVGMLTGDAAVNSGAPILCCEGWPTSRPARAPRAVASRDGRFHFYASRSAACGQVPAARLPPRSPAHVATLGDVSGLASPPV